MQFRRPVRRSARSVPVAPARRSCARAASATPSTVAADTAADRLRAERSDNICRISKSCDGCSAERVQNQSKSQGDFDHLVGFKAVQGTNQTNATNQTKAMNCDDETIRAISVIRSIRVQIGSNRTRQITAPLIRSAIRRSSHAPAHGRSAARLSCSRSESPRKYSGRRSAGCDRTAETSSTGPAP